MEKECNQIKKNAITLSWFMRGGITYNDIMNMSRFERESINELVNNNLETTKKTQLPFF